MKNALHKIGWTLMGSGYITLAGKGLVDLRAIGYRLYRL